MLLAERVFEATGSRLDRCYQCVKCTSGCPLADQFDLTPNQVMRSVQLEDDSVLESRAIWLCVSCHACATRCPQEIDVAGVMDSLRIESRRRGVKPGVPEIARFNELFVRGIRRFGRIWELGLALSFNLALGRPFRDSNLGRRLLARGKLKFLPHFARRNRRSKKSAASPRAVGYFPGCSLSATSIEYGRSVRSVASALDIELVEPQDWVCCGSSPAHATDAQLARSLPLKTLDTVERMGLDTVTSPCSACYSRLKAVERGPVKVSHLLDVIVDRAGLDAVEKRVTRPLNGLKVACYYGCLITRPARLTAAENPEYPVKMERLLRALGAETVDWSNKTECCGGSLGVSMTGVAARLMRRIMDDARACGAGAIVTMCPICHLNLDSRQGEMGYDEEIPIFQATQLMAVAFGRNEKAAALHNNLVDPRPYLSRSMGWQDRSIRLKQVT